MTAATNREQAAVAPEESPFVLGDSVLLVCTAGIWGASFLFMDIGLDAFEPGVVTFLRVGFGCATLWALPMNRSSIPREAWPRVSVLGLTWMAFPLTMFPIAQQWIDSALAGMLNSAMPVFTVIIGIAFFTTSAVRAQTIGVAIGLVGIVLIGVPEATSAGTTALGVGLVVLAVVSYGFAINILGPLQRSHGALPVLRRALLVATLVTLPYGVIDATRSSFAWGPLVACLALGIGGTGIAYVFASILTGRVGAVRASIVTYLVPIFSVLLGVMFRDDSLTVWAAMGTAVVLVGAFIASNGPLGK